MAIAALRPSVTGQRRNPGELKGQLPGENTAVRRRAPEIRIGCPRAWVPEVDVAGRRDRHGRDRRDAGNGPPPSSVPVTGWSVRTASGLLTPATTTKAYLNARPRMRWHGSVASRRCSAPRSWLSRSRATMLSGGPHRSIEPSPGPVVRVWLDAARHELKQPRMPGGGIHRVETWIRTCDVRSLPTLGTRSFLNGRRKT